jgi:hypothetical protein
VFAFEDDFAFAVLQSRVHEIWARFFASSLEDRLRYNPTDCFDTFPLPEATTQVDELGGTYYRQRASIMVENNEGLTKTYNRFHDPHEQSSEILHLRELHAAMDRAVLEAYGWDDLAAAARCEFLLDYVEDSDEAIGDSGGDYGLSPVTSRRSRKKLPWRLRWPDDFRDEVLARLLELNEQRHKEELLAGSGIADSKKKTATKQATNKKSKKKKSDFQQELPGI